MTNYEEFTREQLIERIESLETKIEEDSGYSRRSVIAAAAGVAAAGAGGMYATGVVDADPGGTFPESGDDPLLKIRADRIRFVVRSSDPSSPTGGTRWVVE